MIGQRIREYRIAKGYTVRGFAKLIGISQGSLSDIENEKWQPSGETIASIVRHTNINPLWLLTGEGEMFRAETQSHGRTVAQTHYIDKEKDFTVWAIVELLKDMDEERRQEILKHIEKEKLLLELLEERKRKM